MKGSPVLDFSMTPKKQGTHTQSSEHLTSLPLWEHSIVLLTEACFPDRTGVPGRGCCQAESPNHLVGGSCHCKLSGKVQKTSSNLLVEIYTLQSTDFVRTFLLGSKHWKADLHKTLSYSYPLVEFSLTAYGTMINPLLKPSLTSFSQQICP